MTEPTFELVRVSRELIEQLSKEESRPVVVMSVERYEDGTLNLILREVDRSAA